jgi:hypothetical protein
VCIVIKERRGGQGGRRSAGGGQHEEGGPSAHLQPLPAPVGPATTRVCGFGEREATLRADDARPWASCFVRVASGTRSERKIESRFM